jgi:hypothetical protein
MTVQQLNLGRAVQPFFKVTFFIYFQVDAGGRAGDEGGA